MFGHSSNFNKKEYHLKLISINQKFPLIYNKIHIFIFYRRSKKTFQSTTTQNEITIPEQLLKIYVLPISYETHIYEPWELYYAGSNVPPALIAVHCEDPNP